MLSYEYISFKVDWLIVSGQLYFTINLEEIFYFSNKKEPILCGLWRFANAYPLDYRVRIFWENHFAVLGEAQTTLIDEIEIL